MKTMKASSCFISTLIAAAAMTSTAWAGNLYVSSDYDSSTTGWGTTHFASYSNAYAYATAKGARATIVLEKNNTISSDFCFDNNHKNYPNLTVEVEDGALMGNSLSKWDMTYGVTVKAGGKIEMARPINASVSYAHIKNTLTIGEKDSAKKSYLHFLSDRYADGDISIRYNGSITAYNADITVQDLDAQGTLTLSDSTVAVDGAFSTSSFYETTLKNTNMTVKGSLISGGLSDFSGGDANQLGNFTMSNSTLLFGENASVVLAGGAFFKKVVVENSSTLDAGNLTINRNVTLNITDSTLSVTSITKNNGTITFSGDSTLESGVLKGKVTIAEGATLTVASSSLLADVIANGTLRNNGEIIVQNVDANTTVKANESVTIESKTKSTVKLTASAEITVEKAEQIDLSTENVDVPAGAVAAWSFNIVNEDGNGGKTEVTVTMDVGTGLSLDTIQIWHKGDDADAKWENYTDVVTNKAYDAASGKLTFTTSSFSTYAAANAPEPSAFGLLAGLGALALVAARRRRR